MSAFRISQYLARSIFGVPLFAGIAAAQSTTRESVDSSGYQLPFGGLDPALSGDGQVVAFVSGDSTAYLPILVHDRASGSTDDVSVDSAGVPANGSSSSPAISADGTIVAFVSDATNLVVSDTNGVADIFVHDRVSGITERVSVDSSGGEANAWLYWPPSALFPVLMGSSSPAISSDGNVVAFQTGADNLVAGDTNGNVDVFVHDRTTGITERISIDSSGAEADSWSANPAVSADGRFVAFVSGADNLTAGDTNGAPDVFVHDRVTGITERVSVDSSGNEGSDSDHGGWPESGPLGSYRSAISADGSIVAFESYFNNLVAGDRNQSQDVFVHDRTTGITERVSVDSLGTEADFDSEGPAISSDGSRISFGSGASNLIAGDTNGFPDIFVHDRITGITVRVSVDSSGVEAKDVNVNPAICADGTFVAFESFASNLVASDTNGTSDVFVHEIGWTDASWTNYGAGFPGSNGVPPFTSQSNPVLGTTLTLDLANSYGSSTAGLLFLGFQQTTVHSGWGGDLLVVPFVTIVLSLPPSGVSFTGVLPSDASLFGVAVDLQAIELDPGAARGVSFTQGLELVLGR